MSASTTLGVLRYRWRLGMILAVLAVADLAISWFTYHATVSAVHEQIEIRLKADLAATSHTLSTWMRGKTLEAEVLAHESAVRVGVLGLVGGQVDQREDLRATLQEAVFGLGFDGFAVVDRAGQVLLGVDGELDGGTLVDETRQSLGQALTLPSLITPPLSDPFGRGGPPRILTMVAIDGRAGPVAVLMLTIAPERQFSDLISHGRDAPRSVAYAFDRQGRVLNHRADLLAGRGLATRLVCASGSPAELLPVVRVALAGQPAQDLSGQIDHLSQPRVAAAQWFDDLDLGLYVAVDHDFAMRPVQIGRYSLIAMSALLLLGTLSAAIYLLSNRALGRRLERAQAQIAELGQYQLTSKLGEGGMGAVYLATHRLMRREVAVKLIAGKANQEAITSFEREVQLCCTLTHPNTIQIYDYGRTDEGTFYYAMELLRGIDLEDVVGTYGPLPAARVIHLLRQACGSLAEAHAHQLIHRDIKPANLFLCERGGQVDVIKVLDFGLVKSTGAEVTRLSRDDLITGTPQYLAPEIAKQSKNIDGRSDLYSLACVGYFLLTGTCVFEHEKVMRIVMDHMNTPVPPPSTRTSVPIPSDLEAVIMRSLEKNPSDRYPDAEAMAAALSACKDADGWTQAAARSWWQARALPKPLAEKASTANKRIAPTLTIP